MDRTAIRGSHPPPTTFSLGTALTHTISPVARFRHSAAQPKLPLPTSRTCAYLCAIARLRPQPNSKEKKRLH